MSEAPTRPAEGDKNPGPSLIAMFTVFCTTAVAFMGARVWSRLRLQSFGVDDAFMLFGTMIYIVFTIMIIVVAADGGFRHAYYLTSRQISYALKLNYIAQSIFTVGEACGKSSIAFLLLRIMGVTAAWRKWVMWILIVLTLSISIATLFMTFFQCQNPKALWDEELAKTTSCWAPNVETGWALFVSTWFTLVDFVLAIFPIIFISTLQMSLKRKIALCVLLGLGMLTGIFSALKTNQIVALSKRADGLNTSYYLYAYASVEMFLLVCLGSVPTIKTFYDSALRLARESRLYISLRNLVTQNNQTRQSRLGDDEEQSNIRPNPKAHRQDPAAFDLRQGDTSTFVKSDGGGAWEDSDSQEMGREGVGMGEEGIKMVRTFEVA